MTYLRTTSRPAQRMRRAVVGACALLAFGLAAAQFFAPHFLPAVFTSVAAPFWRAGFAVGSGALSSQAALVALNEALRIELSETALRLETAAAIEAENRELKAFFGRTGSSLGTSSTVPASSPPSSASSASSTAASVSASRAVEAFSPAAIRGRTLAAVLERPPVGAYDMLVIDLGSDEGVAENDKVYAPGDVLIGRVDSVLDHTAKVMLFSSPGEKHEVLIGSGPVVATAVGRGGGQYEAQLARGSLVDEGDFVSAPSFNDRPFARVVSILSDPTQPFVTALMAPPVNIYALRWVLVDAAGR